MIAAIGFSRFNSGKSITTNRIPNHSVCDVPVRISLFQQPEIKMQARDNKTLKLFAVPPSRPTFGTSSLSPAQTIMQFYSSINEKNLEQLDKLIAEDCLFEDYSFPTAFKGKKEVMQFLEKLTNSMGDQRNMQFNVELICEGNDNTAAVNWHLDWKKIQVPFTRGWSYYSLSAHDDKLVIEKAQVLIESPIKLGAAALAMFKIVTSLFDAFPAATEWFLKSPHIMFQLLMACAKPIISPFLTWYTKLLNFAACILSITLTIIHYLAKCFRM